MIARNIYNKGSYIYSKMKRLQFNEYFQNKKSYEYCPI